MKKLWNYRFYALASIGLTMVFSNIRNYPSNINLTLWGIGIIISFYAVLMQIIVAPNYDNNKNKKNDNNSSRM